MHNNGIASDHRFGKIFDELFNKSISDIVGADFTNESPSVNIIESEESFDLEVAAPGLSKEDFSVTIDKDYLSISVDKKVEEGKDSTVFKRKEYNYEKFTRRFRMPKTVDKDSVKAKYDLGILKVSVEKTPEAKEKGPRSIDIN